MAHLLIIELPGGNDTDIIEAAVRLGHSFVFLTQDINVYQRDAKVYQWVRRADAMVVCSSFDERAVEVEVLSAHGNKAFDAVLCLIDIRLIEAARLAQRLDLPYLNTESAKLLRDKYSVRTCLRNAGIAQPEFALATTNAEIHGAVTAVGLPVLIKPSDGYGSQNIITITSEDELEFHQDDLQHLLPFATDYGLGVRSNDRLLVERYMSGVFLGCDTFSLNGQHHLLGVNEKLMFDRPSFAIRGGCFTPNDGRWANLEGYLFNILDAVHFNCGAAHIEIMVTAQGPRLVEINPRLVGAKIARLMSFALNESVHEALINLHLGQWCIDTLDVAHFRPAATRWLSSPASGRLKSIELPSWRDAAVKCVEILKHPGDHVSTPYENAHRLGYVMTCSDDPQQAQAVAERFIRDTQVLIDDA